MWFGVAVALALCLGIAVILQMIGRSLPFKQREIMEGVLALLAVAGVTYMIVWMRRNARGLKQKLESHAELALLTGSVFALVAMAFFAVLREGLETAIFLLAQFQQSQAPLTAGLGAVLGIATAVVLGFGIYKGGVRINLSRFFRITGLVLVLVAGGLLSSAVHEFSEAGAITLLQDPAVDLSAFMAPGTLHTSLITGMLGIQPVPTDAEALVWLAYVVPMGIYVLWPQSPRARQPAVERLTSTA
jgi:high-affinity iron transporter